MIFLGCCYTYVVQVVLVVRIKSLMTSSFNYVRCYDSCISTCSIGYLSIRGDSLKVKYVRYLVSCA